MYGYVYLTTNLINGKKYIGQHKSSNFDKTYLGSGVVLQNAIKKYGRKNFQVELLVECTSGEELALMEVDMINKYQAATSEDYYNLANGLQSPMSELHKEHLRNAHRPENHSGIRNGMYGVHRFGELNPNYGKHYYHHPVTNKEVLISEDVYISSYKQEGFILGRTIQNSKRLHKNLSNRMRGNQFVAGKKWFNNGVVQVLRFECPEGYVPGMLKKHI